MVKATQRALRLRKIVRDKSGATAVEFAIVASAFFLLFIGILEYGMFMMTEVTLESALTQAAREGSINDPTICDCNCVKEKMESIVKQKAGGLARAQSIVFQTNPFIAGGTKKPDICYQNPRPTEPPKTCPTGVPYEDTNKNGKYDPPTSNCDLASGAVIEVRASYEWQSIVPGLGKALFGEKGQYLISTVSVYTNE